MSEEYFEVYRCRGCVMLHFNCMINECITEMIKECPCHNCLVKITCTYDDVCEPYSKFMDKLNLIKEYEKRFEEYETIYNSDEDPLSDREVY